MITHCQHNLYIGQTTRDNALLHLGISGAGDIEIITKVDLQKHGFLNLVLVPHCVHCITTTRYDNKNLLLRYCAILLGIALMYYLFFIQLGRQLCTVYKMQGQLKSGLNATSFLSDII